MSLEIEMLETFIYGMNVREDETELVLGESYDTENFVLDSSGRRLSRRLGMVWADLSGTAFPSIVGGNPVQNLFAWETAPGTWQLIASVYGDIYSINQSTGARTLLFNGTDNTVWRFVAADDSTSVSKVWCMNGTDAPQKLTIGNPPTIAAWAGSPPNGHCHQYWKGRMVVANYSGEGDRLAFSAVGNPESWNLSADFVDLKSVNDDADHNQALEVLGEELYAIKRRSTWKVLSATTFENLRILDHGIPSLVGHVGRSCVMDGTLYFCGQEGIYETDGVSSRMITSRIREPGSDGIEGSATGNFFLCPTGERILAINNALGSTAIYEYYPYLKFNDPHTGLTESPWMKHTMNNFCARCGFTLDTQGTGGRKIYIGGEYNVPDPDLGKIVQWDVPSVEQDKSDTNTNVDVIAEWNSGKFRISTNPDIGRGALYRFARLRKVIFKFGGLYRSTHSKGGFGSVDVDVTGYDRWGGAGQTSLNEVDMETTSMKMYTIRPEIKGDSFKVRISTVTGAGALEPPAIEAPIEFHYRRASL